MTDGLGHSAEARVSDETAKGQVSLVLETLSSSSSASLTLHVYPALLQKGKSDGLIEKAQELRVQSLTPLETKHTVLKMDEEAKIKVMLRWKKIAQEAAKQSGSAKLADLRPPQKFEKALAGLPENEQAVLFHPSGKAQSFAEWAGGISEGESLHLFIGPEGGFSDAEAETFLAGGGKRKIVELGDTLLKADTAFIGIVSSLRFLFP